jgi:hypothetical protein
VCSAVSKERFSNTYATCASHPVSHGSHTAEWNFLCRLVWVWSSKVRHIFIVSYWKRKIHFCSSCTMDQLLYLVIITYQFRGARNLFHHRIHKSPPLVPILSQVDTLYTAPPPSQPISTRSILIPFSHLLCLPSDLFPSGFPNMGTANFVPLQGH